MNVTLYDLAQRFVGIAEISGEKNHPLVSWWLSLCGFGLDAPDEIPWCSAFLNGLAWELRLPRSKSAAARSWLDIGRPIKLEEARAEADVVVFRRGSDEKSGHVGLYAGVRKDGMVLVLGGNQGNSVSISPYPAGDLLGVRRLIG